MQDDFFLLILDFAWFGQVHEAFEIVLVKYFIPYTRMSIVFPLFKRLYLI